MNFVHVVFYIAIFSNMAQCQRARYRVMHYVIVNNVTTATLESKTKNAWKRHWQKRNGNSLNSLYLGVSNSFKDGSSKLNNHSAMAVCKFILALSVQFEFCCLPLDFIWKNPPAIQCARRFFHSYLKETKKINNQFLNISFSHFQWQKCKQSGHWIHFIYQHSNLTLICFYLRIASGQSNITTKREMLLVEF